MDISFKNLGSKVWLTHCHFRWTSRWRCRISCLLPWCWRRHRRCSEFPMFFQTNLPGGVLERPRSTWFPGFPWNFPHKFQVGIPPKEEVRALRQQRSGKNEVPGRYCPTPNPPKKTKNSKIPSAAIAGASIKLRWWYRRSYQWGFPWTWNKVRAQMPKWSPVWCLW